MLACPGLKEVEQISMKFGKINCLIQVCHHSRSLSKISKQNTLCIPKM